MDEIKNNCKNLFLYYRFLLRNLEIDIKAMNNSRQSPEVLQKRKFRKPKKTTLNEIINKREFIKGELTPQEREITDAITDQGNLIDLLYKFYKIGIIVTYTYFEAFNKDMMRVLDNTSDYEKYNILSNLGKNEDLKMLNKTLNIDFEEQYSNWKSLKQGYLIRNMIVHDNGRFDKKSINKLYNLNALNREDIRDIKKHAIDYKQAFEGIVVVINHYFEFFLEQIGICICVFCKKLFEGKLENSDDVPICKKCYNKIGK